MSDEKKNVIVVDGTEYPVVKTGRAQARQLAQAGKWLSNYGVRAFNELSVTPGAIDNLSGVEFIIKLIGMLDEDALIDMFIILVGCSRETAELHFDVAVLIDAAVMVYEQQPTIKRLADRFLSGYNSGSTTEEPSTESEQPTDTQTTK